MKAQAQTRASINTILDTTHVTFSTSALNSDADLKRFIPLFFEFSSIDKKYDSVSHGWGELNIGEMVQCDSVKVFYRKLLVYLSSPKKPTRGFMMPLDLIASAKHYEKEFILEFLFKLSYLYNIPITDIFIFVSTNSESDVELIGSQQTQKAKSTSNYAILFTHELSIARVTTEQNSPLEKIRTQSVELYAMISKYWPTAMLVVERDVSIQYGLGTKDRKQISRTVKKNVEEFMKKEYKKFGNKFISDGAYKFTFQSLQGEISKKNNYWEYFEIGIVYTPYDETSGQFVFTFEGRYKQASPTGNGPDAKVIKTDGNLLEEKYSDEIRSYLDTLSKNLEKYINHERK